MPLGRTREAWRRLSPDGPNPEYPWPRLAPQVTAEHSFDVWQELQGSDAGRRFLHLLRRLFEAAEAFL